LKIMSQSTASAAAKDPYIRRYDVAAELEQEYKRITTPKTVSNSLAVLCPDLMDEWDFEKNRYLGLNPYEVVPGSQRKAMFTCKTCGYNRPVRIFSRAGSQDRKPRMCAVCNKAYHKKTINLMTSYPWLLEYWDGKKNNRAGTKNCVPFAINSLDIEVYWYCKRCQTSWKENIQKQIDTACCPECKIPWVKGSNFLLEPYESYHKKIIDIDRGIIISNPNRINLMLDVKPELLKEWDQVRNDMLKISAQMISADSKVPVFWGCSICGHEWQESVFDRIHNNTGCPCCMKNRMSPEHDTILHTDPGIMKFWDFVGNDEFGVYPNTISRDSNTKCLWICQKCGKSYCATAGDVIKAKRKYCRSCNESKGVKAVKDVLNAHGVVYMQEYCFPDRKGPKGWALRDDFMLFGNTDIIHQNPIAAIEYNGIQHRKAAKFGRMSEKEAEEAFEQGRLRDQIKSEYLKDHGIYQYIIPDTSSKDEIQEMVLNIIKYHGLGHCHKTCESREEDMQLSAS